MIKAISLRGSQGEVDVELDLPDVCPHCGIAMRPEFVSYGLSPASSEVGVIFYCPSCKEIGFSAFRLFTKGVSSWVADFANPKEEVIAERIAVYPSKRKLPPIPKEIKAYYPDFYEIYAQANYAEQINLNKIVGMAYRKALENIVKTHLIETYPTNKEEILKEPLGKSIARIEYSRIQKLAKAASWIGNDETHMVKKNEEWNVADMKKFMLALCHLILSEKVSDSIECKPC